MWLMELRDVSTLLEILAIEEADQLCIRLKGVSTLLEILVGAQPPRPRIRDRDLVSTLLEILVR